MVDTNPLNDPPEQLFDVRVSEYTRKDETNKKFELIQANT